MASKISQLKFGAHKFERAQWNRIKQFEIVSRAPNFPHQVTRSPIFPIIRVSNLPNASSKGPKIFHCGIKGAISRFPNQVT